jgi:hypothetical protein
VIREEVSNIGVQGYGISRAGAGISHDRCEP